MRLNTAEIDRYGPLTSCHPEISDDVTIIAGPNESGKTLYLEAVLQLLKPDLAEVMNPGPRVSQSPNGRVVVDADDESHVLDDETSLSDFSPITANHLYNLFVIRDSDLALPEGPDYYTSLVEQLGDIHTTAIEAIRDELVEQGKLTPGRLNLRNREHDTKTLRNDAEELASEIEDYLAQADEDHLRSLVQERLRLRRELNTVQENLSTQQTAKELATLSDVSEQLQQYRDATGQIDALDAFDEDELEDLRSKNQELSHVEDRISELESSLSQKRDEEERKRETLREKRSRVEKLRQKEAAVESVEASLEEFREQKAANGGAVESKMANRRHISAAGLLGGGIAGGAGAVMNSVFALILGIVLFVVGGAAWYSHRQLSQSVAEAEHLEEAVLETARDAGFAVDSPEAVAPKIRDYRDELEGIESRIRDLEAEIDQITNRVGELEDELSSKESEMGELEDEISQILSNADVESIEEYEQKVNERGEYEESRSNADTVLKRELGEPPAETPTDKIDYWESELEQWESDIDEPTIEAEMFDEEELAQLERRQDELGDDLDAVESDLVEYQGKLDEFERKASEIASPPFVESDPTLDARTVEGLHNLVEQLTSLVREIERNADLSRKAVTILDAMKADEERKVTTLFDPDGLASRMLATITDGRYSTVDYDPEAETLAVERADGQTLTPRQLSRGTQDQLYFAARLSLAKQLLGGDTGFLLLDDPFLAADTTRLSKGFEMLTDLTEDGWQIIYLTAKDEVRDGVAEEFDLPVTEFEMLG